MIRSKYPEGISSDGIKYADMDDDELTRRVVTKYPVYEKQVQLDGDGDDSESPISEFGSGVKESLKERGGDIIGQFKDVATGKEKFTPRTQLRVAGAATGAVGDVTFEALKLVTPKFIEDLAAKGMDKVGETEVAQALMTKYSELKEKHPEAMKDLEDVLNITSMIPIGKGATVAGKGVVKGVSKTGKVVSKITGEALEASRVSRIARATEEIDSVVGHIVQGDTKALSRAKRALSTIDTADVKTYADLKGKIDDGIEALAGKVDEKLEASGKTLGSLKSKDLVTTTKVGNSVVKQKFVEDAIDQLDELYTNIKDAPSQARMAAIREKLTKEGLTLKEVNDLAREYGREFGTKAFGKTGEALTSINAQAFENTRKGIKKVVRDKMPDDVTKMLDERISDLYNTNRYVAKMEEKVNALYQKVKKRGLLENISIKLADTVDVATFHTVSGFISRMLPKNVGNNVMNAINLEGALKANLKKLDKLLITTKDSTLTDGVAKIIKSNSK